MAAGGIPHPRRVVITGGDNALAVGREHRLQNNAGVRSGPLEALNGKGVEIVADAEAVRDHPARGKGTER